MAKKIPDIVRPLFSIESDEPDSLRSQREMSDRKLEAKRVVKRLSAIVLEHYDACLPLNISLSAAELSIVTAALRDHAKGGRGELELEDCDEILSHCLTRLYEELVEEPSNILFTTATGPDSIKYDAMDPSFWIECLDLLESSNPTNRL